MNAGLEVRALHRLASSVLRVAEALRREAAGTGVADAVALDAIGVLTEALDGRLTGLYDAGYADGDDGLVRDIEGHLQDLRCSLLHAECAAVLGRDER